MDELEWYDASDQQPSQAARSIYPKPAWAETPLVVDVRPDQEQVKASDWARLWVFLRKRETAILAENGPPGEYVSAQRALWQDQEAADKSLQQLHSRLWKEVSHVQQAVAEALQQIALARPGHPNVSQLAAAIDRAEAALSTFNRKHTATLQSLVQQEDQLENEIQDIISRVEEQMTSSPSLLAPPAASKLAPSSQCRRSASRSPGRRLSTSLAPEVEEFEAFAQEHGETGGWDPEDHEEFVNILKSCNGDYTRAIEIVNERVIGYTRQDIIKHARWHMDYVDLLMRKRVALAKWRAKKDAEKAKQTATATLLHNESAHQAEEEAQEREWKAMHQAHEQAVKKLLVSQWKEQQAAQARMAAEAAAQQQKEVQQRRMLEQQRQQEYNKMKVELYRAAKDQLRQQAQMAEARRSAEQAARRQPDPQQVRQVAARTQATLKHRQDLLASREEKQMKRSLVQQQLLQKVQVTAPADPHRVLQGTVAHQQRVQAAKQEEHQARDSAFILHVSSRATPSWRAGLKN